MPFEIIFDFSSISNALVVMLDAIFGGLAELFQALATAFSSVVVIG
jgi:hypothetical protein